MNDRLELDLVEATITRLHAGREINDKERREFEALVEIAKAARQLDRSWGYLRDSVEAKKRLRAALSVLDDREAGEPRD